MRCPPCLGTGVGRSSQGTCELCGGRGTLPDDASLTERCNLCLGTGVGGGSRGFCQVCEGYGRLRARTDLPNPNAPFVFFVEAGQPRTAHLELAELFNGVSGEIGICDPYYGTGSLFRLDLLEHCSPIRFLTKNADPNEAAILSRALREWKRQHGATEFRKNSGSELHDRYIITDAELILLGHGLKDVGNKDSFVVRIPTSLAADTVQGVRDSFEQKWASATPIN